MITSKNGDRFVLEVTLSELLTLRCIIAGGIPSIHSYSASFNDPKKVRREAGELHAGTIRLLEFRTLEELEISKNFFKG